MIQPNTQGCRSYFEAFKRRSNVTLDGLQREKMLTDRGAYLNFLEIQLERVSAACIATQDLGDRIDVFAAKATTAEEKVFSTTKLVRLAQTYSEEQGREQGRINESIESRLGTLQQEVDALRVAVDDAASGCSRRPSGLSDINTEGLSEWMIGIDKQLEDLRSIVSTHLTGRSQSIIADNGGPGVTEGRLPPSEADGLAASAEAAMKATAEATARDTMEERVARLETALGQTDMGKGEARCGDDTKCSSAPAEERGLGCRLKHCAELARDGLSRSRSPSHSPTRTTPLPQHSSTLPSPPSAVEAAPVVNDGLLGAVEEGTAVARRASEVAQEALKVGREAVERSERTESLTKTLIARSLKLAREQHEEITNTMDRLDGNGNGRQKGDRFPCHQRSAGGTRGRRIDSAGVTYATGTVLPAGAAGSRRGRCRSAASAIPEEARPAKGPRGNLRGRGGQAPRATEVEGTDAGAAPGTHRSVRKIREILEQSTFGDSDNGRRIALGAARTALESILREASPRSLGCDAEHTEEREERSAATAAEDHEFRKVDELREAIRGAVTILSRVGGRSSLQGEETQQRQPSRCLRRGRKPGSRLSRSRDRATTPPRGGRNGSNRHAEGHWVPPGNIPYKIGERKVGGLTKVRAPREMPGEEEEEEAGPVPVVV